MKHASDDDPNPRPRANTSPNIETPSSTTQAASLLSVRLADIPRSGQRGSINATATVYSRRIERDTPKARLCWLVGDRYVGEKSDVWQLVGRTELIRRRASPVFADTFKLEYVPESLRDISIRVEVYNIVRTLGHTWHSKDKLRTRRSDFVGACEVDLVDLVKASERGGEAKAALHNVLSPLNRDGDGKNGYAILTADPVRKRDVRMYELEIDMKHVKLRTAQQALKVHRFDPFLQIFRKRRGSMNAWAFVYRSETLHKAKDVQSFQPIVVPVEVLVGSDEKTPFRIEICHNRGHKRYRLLGWVNITPGHIISACEGATICDVSGASLPGRKYDFDAKVIGARCQAKRESCDWLVPLKFTIAATPSYNLLPIRTIRRRQGKKFRMELDPTKEAKSWQVEETLENMSDSSSG